MGTVSDARHEDPWYTHAQQAEAIDRAYGQIMATAQWAGSNLMHGVSGATGIGTAGYNAWSALSKALGGLTMGQIGFQGNGSRGNRE